MLGLCVGSFLNVLIFRLPQAINNGHRTLGILNALCRPSRCPSCRERIKPWHNIPVLGFIALRGRSSCCDLPISPRYPVIEALTGGLSLLIALLTGSNMVILVASLVFLWIVIAAAFIDTDSMLLPDILTVPLLAMGLFVNAYGGFTPMIDAIFGAGIGYGVLWLVAMLHFWRTGQDGLGRGDMKLTAALGAWFGWMCIPAVFIIAGLTGLAAVFLFKPSATEKLPFGPYLSLAGLVLLFAFLSSHGAWLSII